MENQTEETKVVRCKAIDRADRFLMLVKNDAGQIIRTDIIRRRNIARFTRETFAGDTAVVEIQPIFISGGRVDNASTREWCATRGLCVACFKVLGMTDRLTGGPETPCFECCKARHRACVSHRCACRGKYPTRVVDLGFRAYESCTRCLGTTSKRVFGSSEYRGNA